MPKFFYRLQKAKSDNVGFGRYEPIWYDIVEAETKDDAKVAIAADLDAVIAEKISKNAKKHIDYQIFIVPLDDKWDQYWNTIRSCKSCDTKYTALKMKQLDLNGSAGGGGGDFCSSRCRSRHYDSTAVDYREASNKHKPIIYKVTHEPSGQTYIGQTRQAFTLRWYQHFFQPEDTPFHRLIKATPMSDWMFQILEVCSNASKEAVDAREKYWIDKFDTIRNGLNSAAAPGSKNKSKDKD